VAGLNFSVSAAIGFHLAVRCRCPRRVAADVGDQQDSIHRRDAEHEMKPMAADTLKSGRHIETQDSPRDREGMPDSASRLSRTELNRLLEQHADQQQAERTMTGAASALRSARRTRRSIRPGSLRIGTFSAMRRWFRHGRSSRGRARCI